MNPIRIDDLVRLRHTPSWTCRVLHADASVEHVMVAHPVAGGFVVMAWVHPEFLEFVPDANPEVMAA